MRVLMTTNPGLGHLHPMVPVAEALAREGHEVAFACARSFGPKVEALGFRCFPAGLDWLESRAEETFEELRQLSVEENPAYFLTDIFADAAAHEMVPDLLSLCRSWRPDLLVRNDYEFGASVAAELLDIPCATVSIELLMPPHWWRAQVGEQLAYLRSVHGLAPYPAQDPFYRHLYLSFAPPSLQFPDYPTPPSVRFIRPALFDHTDGRELPEWVPRLPERPTVYATLGTVFNQRPDVFRAVVDGLAGEDLNVILTVGSEQDPRALGPHPENVRVERYIPLTLLLPHCDAAITHAGFGTMLSCLAHGLPMLSVPVSATDPFHAARCVAAGAGLALNVPGLAQSADQGFPALSAETVRASVRALLDEPRFRRAAERVRDEAAALPGVGEAARMAAALAAERAAAA